VGPAVVMTFMLPTTSFCNALAALPVGTDVLFNSHFFCLPLHSELQLDPNTNGFIFYGFAILDLPSFRYVTQRPIFVRW